MPVRETQDRLSAQVCGLLDILPDLADHFEVLIVDDGSTDQTEEAALELAHRFPQVRVVRHRERRGVAAAVQTGMSMTAGELVLVHYQDTPINSSLLERLWRLRDDPHLVAARTAAPTPDVSVGLLTRLINWGRGVEQLGHVTQQAGIQLLRRQALARVDDAAERRPTARRADPPARRIARPRNQSLLRRVKDFAVSE